MSWTMDLSHMTHEQAFRILFGAVAKWNHHVHDAAQDREVRQIEAQRHAEAVREANDAQ